jgi:transcriptional regulator with XRE-family HTH domain
MTAIGLVLGRHLRTLRLRRGLSLTETGRRMGSTPHRVYAIENSGKELRISTVIRYCEAIGARIVIKLEDR